MRRLTQQEFIAKARAIHEDKYDYKNVVYVNNRTKVFILCKRCGTIFEQKAGAHLNGQGCSHCSRLGKTFLSKRTIVWGVGFYDVPYPVSINEETSCAHSCWSNMLLRCYSKKYQEKEPSYIGCSVCDEWLYFSNFKAWFDQNHIKGFCLDKDILFKGNKIYSPETCCFVPYAINNIFSLKKSGRGKMPLGVRRTPKGKYQARLMLRPHHLYLGTYETIEEAFNAYRHAKEAHIKEVAQEYYNKGEITERVYDALMKYEVEITD